MATLVCSLGLAQGTWADPITACDDPNTGCFDGAVIPTESFPDDQHWGMSAEQAASLGVPIVQLNIWSAESLIDVTGNFLEITPIDEVEVPFTHTSEWGIESLDSGAIGMIEDAYLLFLTATNKTGLVYETSYDETEVGVTMTGSTSDWVVVEGDANGTQVYFLGISLGDLFEQAGATTLIDVAYYLDNPETFPLSEGLEIVVLPRLEIAIAGTLVPEPGTGLLLGLGLVLIGATRRRLQ
jgi:hypothetical protein